MLYFGGKGRVARLIWDRIGDVDNAVEPFCGSAAWLLARPTPPKVETVNDADSMVANFWRATQHDPEKVAEYADYPVQEIDLHARHRWLVLSESAVEFRQKMRTDPEYYDAKVAGWWCWGACAWIGSGWCTAPKDDAVQGDVDEVPLPELIDVENEVEKPAEYRDIPGFPSYRVGDDGSVWTSKRKGGNDHAPGRTGEWRRMKLHMTKGYYRVNLDRDGKTYSRCVHRLVLEAFIGPRPDGMEARHFPDGDKTNCRLDNLSWASHLVNMQDKAIHRDQLPLIGDPPRGVHRVAGRPQLADAYDIGRGVNASPPQGQRVTLGDGNRGAMMAGATYLEANTCAKRRAWLIEWFGRLRDRLRTVRVCCGDWLRVCDSESVTTRLGVTGIFFDPPYSTEAGRSMDLYSVDCGTVAHKVRAYCLERGSNPKMRLCLAGYAGEGHEELESHGWDCVEWRSQGGYGNRSEKGKENSAKERLWYSPHCKREAGLFDGVPA